MSCLLSDYKLPTTYYGNQETPLKMDEFFQICSIRACQETLDELSHNVERSLTTISIAHRFTKKLVAWDKKFMIYINGWYEGHIENVRPTTKSLELVTLKALQTQGLKWYKYCGG